jgi:hypothetical protein
MKVLLSNFSPRPLRSAFTQENAGFESGWGYAGTSGPSTNR